ncbi:MAG: type II toxin-antitoxin system ParD family antitoxin [Pyrinomonadaceae bacterium]
MRRTITISVSDEMHSLISEGMRSHFYSTVSEYIRFLVRRDQRPDAVHEPKLVYAEPRTVNQCIEDALREIEAEKGSLVSN